MDDDPFANIQFPNVSPEEIEENAKVWRFEMLKSLIAKSVVGILVIGLAIWQWRKAQPEEIQEEIE